MLLELAALPALAFSAPSGEAWQPVDSHGTTRYSANGLFPTGSGIKTVQATVTKHQSNPLFNQDKPWEPRLDNGCELSRAITPHASQQHHVRAHLQIRT